MTYVVASPDSPPLTPSPDNRALAAVQLERAVIAAGAEDHRAETLAFLRTHADSLVRSGPVGHLTGSAIVLDPSTRRVLMIHHAKLNRWLQPGGHADGDGNLAAVAWREVTEETGLDHLAVVLPAVDVDVHPVPARGDEPAHLHFDVRFLVVATGGVEPTINHEATAVRWVEPDAEELSADTEFGRMVGQAMVAFDQVASSLPARPGGQSADRGAA
ncbi:MAG: NUDIX hydrolase [Acidimicrobiales bacterium]